MALVCGPKNSRYTYTGSRSPHTDLAIEVDAATVRDAVAAYEAKFHCNIAPAPDYGRLYFLHTDVSTGSYVMVAIHVVRANETIDVKQNLEIALQANDIVDIVQVVGG